MRALKLLLCAAILGFLGACSTLQDMMGVEPKGSGTIVNSDSFCVVAQPIPWKSTDNPETIDGVKINNALGIRLCHWQGHAVPSSPKP